MTTMTTILSHLRHPTRIYPSSSVEGFWLARWGRYGYDLYFCSDGFGTNPGPKFVGRGGWQTLCQVKAAVRVYDRCAPWQQWPAPRKKAS